MAQRINCAASVTIAVATWLPGGKHRVPTYVTMYRNKTSAVSEYDG